MALNYLGQIYKLPGIYKESSDNSIKILQDLLNEFPYQLIPNQPIISPKLKEDGDLGDATKKAIKDLNEISKTLSTQNDNHKEAGKLINVAIASFNANNINDTIDKLKLASKILGKEYWNREEKENYNKQTRFPNYFPTPWLQRERTEQYDTRNVFGNGPNYKWIPSYYELFLQGQLPSIYDPRLPRHIGKVDLNKPLHFITSPGIKPDKDAPKEFSSSEDKTEWLKLKALYDEFKGQELASGRFKPDDKVNLASIKNNLDYFYKISNKI